MTIMNASIRFSLLAVGLALATGCAVNSAPDGERQANNGDDTVYSRTFVRIEPNGTKTSDIRFVTKRAQTEARDRGKNDGIAHAPSTGAAAPEAASGKGKIDDRYQPATGDVTKVEVEAVIEACPGLEIFDGENQTGNSVCFAADVAPMSEIDLARALAEMGRYADCGNGTFCFDGHWGGAVRSRTADPRLAETTVVTFPSSSTSTSGK